MRTTHPGCPPGGGILFYFLIEKENTMPNWCVNQIHVDGPDAAEIEQLLTEPIV